MLRDGEARRAASSASTEQLVHELLRYRALTAVFVPKAQYVLRAAVDSLGLANESAQAFRNEGAVTLNELFEANPSASSAEMRDAILPVVDGYRAQVDAFNADALTVLTQAAVSMNLSSAAGTKLYALSQPLLFELRGHNLSARPYEMRIAIASAVAETQRFAQAEQASAIPKGRQQRKGP
jgi:hypothetical protein